MARFAVNSVLTGGLNPVTNTKRGEATPAGDVAGGITSSLSSVLSATTSLSTANVTLSSALSVLTADAATPTQSHVSTAAAAFGTVNTGISSTLSSVGAVSTSPITNPDAQLSWNTTTITTFGQLQEATRELLRAALASGKVTN